MQPVEFPEHNHVWAKNQPPYLPLPAFVNEQETISCWALTWRERLRVLWNGRLWLRQLNFSERLQPQQICIDSPFVDALAAGRETHAKEETDVDGEAVTRMQRATQDGRMGTSNPYRVGHAADVADSGCVASAPRPGAGDSTGVGETPAKESKP